MKHLLLILSVIIVGGISAQTLESVNANIQLPFDATEMNGINSLAKTTACGPDTNGYALAKATGLQALNLNNATSATGVSQYFDAPQAITISGVSFYAWKADAVGGTSLNAVVEVYAAALDSTPTGAPLASVTVAVDTVFGTGTLDVLRKNGTFAVPVTVSSAYVVVVLNPSPNSISMVFNSWSAAPTPDGASEWLASALIGANWLRSYNVNIGGDLFNADCLVEPHTTYDLSSNFIIDNLCNQAGVVSSFTNASSPIVANRMYNIAAFQSIPEFSYTWDYGDASSTENVIDATHIYAAAGPYTVTLTDTIYGWTTNCADDTMATISIVAASISSFTSSVAALTVSFTNTSVGGTGATYSWDFGDGNMSALTDPTHTYALTGNYTVCLTISDACGTDSTCQTITVPSCTTPIADFASAETGTGTGVFDFTNTSTTIGATTYLWDFGDGNTGTAMDPTHSYTSGGTYTVVLTVTDSCGSNSFTATVSSTLGVANLTLADVSIYPNPSSGIFKVEASAEMEIAYVTDISGKLVYTETLSGNETTINAAQFANGTYFLSIRFENDMIQTVRLEVVK